MITPLLLSEVTLPEQHPRAGAACGVFGFVVSHDGGPVLVDSGVGSGHPRLDELYRPRNHDLERALARAAVDIGDITMVINSHLHFDHCGNNRRFPGIPLVAQRTEHQLALAGGHTIEEWITFAGADWHLVDGASELLPGIDVIPTPGHTPGHQSVLVRQGGSTEVIAAQAVYDPDELTAEASTEPLSEERAAATTASARRIKALQPDRVYFSHDPRIWTPGGIVDPA